jgi:hypothetical protein
VTSTRDLRHQLQELPGGRFGKRRIVDVQVEFFNRSAAGCRPQGGEQSLARLPIIERLPGAIER